MKKKTTVNNQQHGSMNKDHEMSMKHGSMNNMDHEMPMEHGSMNMDHEMPMEHGSMNMDHEMPMEHGSMNMDHGMSMKHGSMNMDHDMMMHGGQMMHMGNLKQKFWISLILALPVLLLAPVMGLDRPLISWEGGASKGLVILLFDALLYFYGGAPFLKGSVAEVKDKKPAMMTLITLGISVSFFYSLYAILINNFGHPQTSVMDFSFELATLILIMLLGHWIEMNAVMGAGNALDKIAALLPSTAHLINKNGQTTDVKLAELQEGQRVQVRAGESLPTDGIVMAGSSTVNEALVTGEAAAVTKKVNDQVIGGSINENGTLTVKITKIGQNGYLSQVMEMVQQAQQAKSKAETRADTVAGYLFYAAVIVGLIAFFAWLPQGLATALSRMVTVLVIACPHALGVAIPLVVARSTSIGAKKGLLLRNRQALEATKSLSHIFFDKTGTLTAGKFKLNALVPANGYPKEQLLGNLAALEANSSHPLAQAILSAAKTQQLQLPTAQQVKTLPGIGLSGQINGKQYLIANLGYLTKKQLKFDQQQVETWSSRGNTISFLLDDQEQILGMMAAGDQLKTGARELVVKLKKQGITPVMLTGDNQAAAKYAADQLGITDYHAGLLPADKQQIIEKYQHDGKHVMMVGDGVNDAPSLAAADLGVAIGAGTDVAIDSADVILVKSDPHDILSFLTLAKLTNRKMIQNLWWGAGYNLAALPLAAGILAPIGIVLDPAVGAIIMALSTIIVALNAMTLTEKAI